MKHAKSWGVINTADRGLCLQFVVGDPYDVILLKLNKRNLTELITCLAQAFEMLCTQAENEMPKMPWEKEP